MTISITFWYETKENAQQAKDKESSGIVDDNYQNEDESKPNEQESQPNTDAHTRVATAAEQLALRRDIEESVMEAIGDASKVNKT